MAYSNIFIGGCSITFLQGASTIRICHWSKVAPLPLPLRIANFVGTLLFLKGLIHSQQDAVASTVVQRSQTPTSVGNSEVHTPTSATSNAGTPASASSSVSRAAAGGGSDSEGAFFREEEKGRGISPASSTTSASRRFIVKGKLQVKQCPICLFLCLPVSVLIVILDVSTEMVDLHVFNILYCIQ